MAVIRRSQLITPAGIKVKAYSDIDSAFNIHPNTRDVSLLINEDAVKTSIRNILLTRKGERVFNTLYGSDLQSILFENITPQTELTLKKYIETSITNFEPRAKLIEVIATGMPDENGYVVTIIFGVINKTEPIKLELLLNRIR